MIFIIWINVYFFLDFVSSSSSSSILKVIFEVWVVFGDNSDFFDIMVLILFIVYFDLMGVEGVRFLVCEFLME